jgi:hypothetical protein
MEKKLFMDLGLHLYTEIQLFHIIALLGILKMILMLFLLKKKNYFVEIYDYFILGGSIYWLTYVLFMQEHLTFFSCIFYNIIYLFMMYWAFWYIKYVLKDDCD